MKKLLFILMLVLVCITGQAKVKTGLDLCLRDEKTGDWLIGLFDDFAVYNCEYWDYQQVDKDHIVLVNNRERLNVKLKKNSAIINGMKYKTSVLTSKYLPDYPSKEKTLFSDKMNDKESNAVIRIFTRSKKEGMPFSVTYDRIIDGQYYDDNWRLDEQGRMEKAFPIPCETLFSVSGYDTKNIMQGLGEQTRWYGWLNIVLKPGQRIMVFIDDINGHIYAMGDGSRLTNEMAANQIDMSNVSIQKAYEMPLDSFVDENIAAYQSNIEKLDKIIKDHPMLSDRYYILNRENIRYTMAGMLTSLSVMHWGKSDSLKQLFARHITPDFMKPQVPVVVGYDMSFCINTYIDYFEEHSIISSYGFKDVVKQAISEGATMMDDELRKVLDESEVLSDSVDILKKEGKDNELPALFERYKGLAEQTSNLYSSHNLRSVMKSMMLPKILKKRFEIMDSLGVSKPVRDIMAAQYIFKYLDNGGHPCNQQTLDLFQKEVSEPYLVEKIIQKNAEVSSLALRAKTNSNTTIMDNKEIEGLTDGESIFRKLTEPHHGHYIYVTFWQNQSTPVKNELENFPKLMETLESEDMVYLFVYYGVVSSDEEWRSNIERYHLTDNNCVHYNLSQKQYEALVNYIRKGSFPSFNVGTHLIAPNGQLLPTEAPRPSEAEAVKLMIDELEKQ